MVRLSIWPKTVWYGHQRQFTSTAAWGYVDTDEVQGHKVDDLQAVCEQGKPFKASSCRAEMVSAFEFEESPQV